MGGRSDYEGRRKRRIESYKQKSAKAMKEAEERENSTANRILSMTAGQPILVGHHSERKAINLHRQAERDIRKSIELSDKSKYYERRAKSVENSKVIYNDDPNAIKKLEEKLERLQNQKESIKAREHEKWELDNINANIRETKKRIERLKEQEKIKFKDINFNYGKVIHNKEKNRIQFLFNNIPDEEYRKILKSHGFHWSRMEKAWQREFNLNCIKATNIILEEFNEMQKEGEEFE